MKIKKYLVVFASIFSISLFAGNIFAAYTISDEAAKNGIKISLDVPDKQYYLNAGVWETQNPVYFAHFWNGAPALDVKMDACESAGYYTCEASMLYRNVCFVRMPTGSTSLDWDTKWNQTKDITIDLNYDTYEITDWGVDDLAITGHGDNHDPKVRYETITPATASECAVKNKITYCGICEEILEQESFIDHEHLTEHAAIAATCTADGNIHYYSCDHCGKYYSDALAEHEITDHSSVIIPATGHSFTDNYGSDATNHWLICDHGCGETDSIEPHTFVGGVCSVCGYVQAHVHSYQNHPAVAPTCTTDGNAQYYTCSGCDHIFDVNYQQIASIPIIPATGHTYVNHVCECGDIEAGYTLVSFEVVKDAGYGNYIILVGSFNGWSLTNDYIALDCVNSKYWRGSIVLANGSYSFKSIHVCTDVNRSYWESGDNHQITLTGGTYSVPSYDGYYNYS